MYMKIQLIRHATHVITYGGKKFLLDPVFCSEGTLPPVQNTPNQKHNPLTNLPVQVADLVAVDAVFITHTHGDHFDKEAISALPKSLPLFCQPQDEEKMKGNGFTNVIAIQDQYEWEGIVINRTGGRHGKGTLADQMGPVSGFVLRSEMDPTLYIIGDSVWCTEVEAAFHTFVPDVSIAFAGEARFLHGDPITMGLPDIDMIVKHFPHTHLIISHMESWNHCLLTRKEVHSFIDSYQLHRKISVPQDGEILEFSMNRSEAYPSSQHITK